MERCRLCNSEIRLGRCTWLKCANSFTRVEPVEVPEYVSSETVHGDEDSRLNLSFNIRVF